MRWKEGVEADGLKPEILTAALMRASTRRGVNWSDTTEVLERELRELEAEDILLQMFVTRRECRRDGWIRADARPSHPAVILSFDSKWGPLSYPCQTFETWKANVRAIALALEALRKVDRYGVTSTGQQYTGWKRLPPPGGSTITTGRRDAAAVLIRHGGEPWVPEDVDDLLEDPDLVRAAYRDAARATHPDRGGDREAFEAVKAAKRVLEAAHS